MQKKNNLLRDSSNSSCKLALANVSASLNRDSSAREQDRSREFWHLSGQQGSLISETDDNPLRKLQNKILQLYSQSRDNDLQ